MHKHKKPQHASQVATAKLPRTIAFYLPQFHPIPENNAWWGKGFTEWTNVGRAEPLFDGHHQPRRPADLGYYDLRVPEIMEQQAELARQHGIHGFCYYYYWFAGHRLLEKPLDRMLESGSPDFPFCLCWANENWSRRWDGSEQEVLMKQEYGPDYARRILRDMLPFLQDERYITVDGKPLLLVYRVDIIPDCAEMTEIWREEALAAGLPGLYLVRVESFVELDPRAYGFDAACEFPPHLLNTVTIADRDATPNLHADFEGHVFEYSKVALHYGNKPAPEYKRFKNAVPSWDNTARKKLKSVVIANATPDLYKAWLSLCLRETSKRFKGEERLVFINAWNEWAEGCYLEPDEKFGHAYLEATRDAHVTVAAELKSASSVRTVQSHMDFAVALFDSDQMEDASEAFQKIIATDKKNPLALVYLGLIALSADLQEDAKSFFDHAVEFSQDWANTMAAIGQRCMEAGHLDFAELYFSAAIKTQPKLTGAFALLADVWEKQGRTEEAMQLLASMVKMDSSAVPGVLSRLIPLARELGDLEAEYAACVRGSAFPDSHARAIELMTWRDDTTIAQVRDQATRFAANHAGGRTVGTAENRDAGARTRLKVGFVVGRLDADCVRYRVEPLLRKLDADRFETIVFAKDASAGDAAQRLFLLADYWKPLAGLDTAESDEVMRKADADILINLDGYASLAALEPFTRRMAPLQLNWSHPRITLGLRSVDAVIVEKPWGSDIAASAFTEQVISLPLHAATEFPQIAERLARPDADDMPFTFGCMVPIAHIADKTWDTWAEMLLRLPEARLQLNYAELGDAARQRVLRRLADKGVAAARVIWVSALNARVASDAWQSVNLGLCPLAGDSSDVVLAAASAGIASIAISQGTPWTRAAADLMQNLGLDNLVAATAEEYVELTIRLAQDRDTLQEVARAMQQRLQQSPFVDTAGFAAAFGAALETLWREKGGTLEGRS